LPPTLFNPEKPPTPNTTPGPFESYFLFYGVAGKPADVKIPYNLAYLYTTKLITTPKTFYDPGLRHPDLILVRFEMKYYENATYPCPSATTSEKMCGATTCIIRSPIDWRKQRLGRRRGVVARGGEVFAVGRPAFHGHGLDLHREDKAAHHEQESGWDQCDVG